MKPGAKSPALSKRRAFYCNKNLHASVSSCFIIYAFTIYSYTTQSIFTSSLNTGFQFSGICLHLLLLPHQVKPLLSSSRMVSPGKPSRVCPGSQLLL